MTASRRIAIWIGLGIALTLLLRAPWFDAALGRDEGGVALIARAWHGAGPFTYGSYFLDRPPLLVALYRLVGGSDSGIRILGAAAAAAVVATSTMIAVRVGGRRAAPWAAGISAVLASSFAIRSVFTPAELLAVVPSSASVLLLLIAIEDRVARRRLWLLAVAGALAVAALLVKQSFGDALAAGVVALVAGKLLGLSWRETLRRAGAYLGGVAVAMTALLVWTLLTRTSDQSVWYAMFGFRLDAAHALAGPGLGTRLAKLQTPAVSSRLVLAFALAVVGIAAVRGRPLVRPVLCAWVFAALVGIVLGGSYWPHYLIALIPATAAGAAALLARRSWIAVLAVCAIAAPTALGALRAERADSADALESSAVTIGRYIRARALPGETAYVLYAKVNTLYYAGMRDPFPYNWSLMLRSVPGVQTRLRAMLASPGRPTWVVRAERTTAFGLDASGATQRLLKAHYRLAGTVCGERVLLARGAPALPPPAGVRCAVPNSEAAPS